jgi:hypothetical protein
MRFVLSLLLLGLSIVSASAEPVYAWKAGSDGRQDLFRNGKRLGSWNPAVNIFTTLAHEQIPYDGSQDGSLCYCPDTDTMVAPPSGDDALAEVNALRAARGLPPFIKDDHLTSAARTAAQHRACNLCSGHTSNDFACLPAGCSASAAGCAAWHPSEGWGSCCTYDSYTYNNPRMFTDRWGARWESVRRSCRWPFCLILPCGSALSVSATGVVSEIVP